MNPLAKYSLFCFLLLLATLKCSCQRYYRQESIGSNLCESERTIISFFTLSTNKYELHLDRNYQSVVIEKRLNASQIKRMKSSDCKFIIDTKLFGKNSGIYVNILKMKLRQVKLTNACIDSLVIKYNDRMKRRYCGELEPGEIKSTEDTEGKVKITLSVDRGVPFNDPDDYIEFQIVATAFKECHDLDAEFMCKKHVIRSCISNAFANDTIVNCNDPDCADERLGCKASSSISPLVEPQQTPTNVPQIFLSAITSLVLTMLCCGSCVWIVFKIKRCCCPRQPQQTTTTRIHRRRRRNNQNDSEVPTSSQDVTPTAPAGDKDDLPPSYSVLFPERVKEEAQNT